MQERPVLMQVASKGGGGSCRKRPWLDEEEESRLVEFQTDSK